MKIQSLSIHVPTGKCFNNCKPCVSQMHDSPYPNRIGGAIEDDIEFSSATRRVKEEYIRRLQFAKDNGVNTIILTGTGETIQNKRFLKWFGEINKQIGFHWIELQTAGNLLLYKEAKSDGRTGDDFDFYTNIAFMRTIGVSTISLSLFDMFSSELNAEITEMPKAHVFDVDELCHKIKQFNLNLRLSLNIYRGYKDYSISEIFKRANELEADQITFRKLYESEDKSLKQNQWIRLQNADGVLDRFFDDLNAYIKANGVFLGKLPFGGMKYSVNDISVVTDDNCMDNAEERVDPDVYKYLILRPNAKLYSDWSFKSSLIF